MATSRKTLKRRKSDFKQPVKHIDDVIGKSYELPPLDMKEMRILLSLTAFSIVCLVSVVILYLFS